MEQITNEVILNDNNKKCIGCGVCSVLCPKRAIEMKNNKEGFKYPLIDKNKCINCNICRKKCPVLNNILYKNKINKVFAYCTNNNDNWYSSTSGGAFYDICCAWDSIYPETIIYGAFLDDNYELFHVATNIKELFKIQKSKYIQSDIIKILQDLKNNLNNNKSVIFSGTPCQIAAVKSYLNKEYDKLLLIDVVCHGVGSSDVFKKCIKYEEKKFGKKIIQYSFRYKNQKDAIASRRYNVKYTFEDNSDIVTNNDLYMKLFLKGSCLRDSCGYNCKFKANNSKSDISLADLNNKSKIIPKIYDKRNYSAIFAHSDKGVNVLNKLDKFGKLIECTKHKVVRYNKVYDRNNDKNNNRDKFFEEYISKNMTIDDTFVNDTFCVKTNSLSLIDRLPYFLKFLVNYFKEILNHEKE